MNKLFSDKPIARWTIGPVQKDGFDCLFRSIEAFKQLYDAEIVICYNCSEKNLGDRVGQFRLVNQHEFNDSCKIKAFGVSWKLYPSRLDITRHELVMDNDIILQERVPQIDQFFSSDCTLLLGENSRTYGRFEKFVPAGYCINSGIYGMPPGFDLQKYLNFHVRDEWEKNAFAQHDQSETFDEQGLIAFALASYPQCVIIPSTSVTNCEHQLVEGKGLHFIGLNRRTFHRPYHLYKSRMVKFFL